MKTIVISGFPGVGKSTMSNANILDSDSSKFSWTQEGMRHPDFPNNYMEHIKNNLGKVEFILVSSHDTVRNALREHAIHYTLVYPSIELKDEYVQRYRNRENPEPFITFISSNWENFIHTLQNEIFPRKIKLKSHQFLSDVLEEIRYGMSQM